MHFLAPSVAQPDTSDQIGASELPFVVYGCVTRLIHNLSVKLTSSTSGEQNIAFVIITTKIISRNAEPRANRDP